LFERGPREIAVEIASMPSKAAGIDSPNESYATKTECAMRLDSDIEKGALLSGSFS
jgi:hypothetical protein